jgi:hypothetical protein
MSTARSTRACGAAESDHTTQRAVTEAGDLGGSARYHQASNLDRIRATSSGGGHAPTAGMEIGRRTPHRTRDRVLTTHPTPAALTVRAHPNATRDLGEFGLPCAGSTRGWSRHNRTEMSEAAGRTAAKTDGAASRRGSRPPVAGRGGGHRLHGRTPATRQRHPGQRDRSERPVEEERVPANRNEYRKSNVTATDDTRSWRVVARSTARSTPGARQEPTTTLRIRPRNSADILKSFATRRAMHGRCRRSGCRSASPAPQTKCDALL